MKIRELHSWDIKPTEAAALQRSLAGQIDVHTPLTRWDLVAGADISYNRFSPTIYVAVVVIRATDGAIVETQEVIQDTTFPYIPGFLSFREAPAVLEAFRRLQIEPDVVMVDGQALAHPRRFGLGCHLGLWLDRPCLGCAKSRLVGTFREPGRRAGSVASLQDGGETIGKVVRTKDGTRPLFVSAGHQIDLASAVQVVLGTCRGYRIPEPTRQAHLHVNAMRRGDAMIAKAK
jgi:deoxyribonuclease V